MSSQADCFTADSLRSQIEVECVFQTHKRRLRIVSVSTVYPSPSQPHAGLFVRHRLQSLAQIDDVSVLHLCPWFPWVRPFQVRDDADSESDQPPVSHHPMFYIPGVLKSLDGYWVSRSVTSAFRDLASSPEIDLIDAHFGYPEGVGCVHAAIASGRPVFLTLRGLESQVLADQLRGAQLRWALRRCRGIICVSESLKCLVTDQGISPQKIRVIPNAVDRRLFSPGDRGAARRELGIAPNAQLIVCTGMLVRGKGQHLLIQALKQLTSRHSRLQLALVGGSAHEPSYPQEIQNLVSRLRLENSVIFAGPQSPKRVVSWLRAADLFALPTFDEGCCNAILEAMACGLPVVTTPVGDNARLVDPPRRGRFTPCGNIETLAHAIEETIQQEWNYNAISKFGQEYTWDEVARQTDDFFRERLRESAD